MTCKDCIHYDACTDWIPPEELLEVIKPEGCNKFKNKADFVEVVRCKDCKLRKTNDCAMYHECICGRQLDWENNYDFCSYGERKEQ